MNAMRSPPGMPQTLLQPEQLRIVSALTHRARYRYVQPVVLPEQGGWVIVSPNCSRNVDPNGGDIGIAWLLPEAGRAAVDHDQRLWRLHVRDHGLGVWRLKAAGLTLDAALERICTDPQREFWP